MFVDTNVLIALMVEGRDSQREEALAKLEQLRVDTEPALVCESVLVETCWVLERSYGLRRREAAESVRALLSTPPLRTWDPAVTDAALALMARRPALSITDCLLLRRVAGSGSPLLSFDVGLLREARRSP